MLLSSAPQFQSHLYKPVLVLAVLMFCVATGASGMPADTYFSIAVTENSHNHYGENLMFLDFTDGSEVKSRHPRTVIATKFENNDIVMDGLSDDWHPDLFTVIQSRAMNNYPLDKFYDVTPTNITIASGFDNEYVYFMLQWIDANHDASINKNRWVRVNGQWSRMKHTKPRLDAPAGKTLNRGDPVAAFEDEDRILMMFPIVDNEHNFTDGAKGCAGYCHPNLRLSVDPGKGLIGDGASSMHTNYPDDKADIWHWTSSRSALMGSVKDAFLNYGDESYNGRKPDNGSLPFKKNALDKPIRPAYVSKKAYLEEKYTIAGYRTERLNENDLLPITGDMSFAEGVSLPFFIGIKPTGNVADVQTAASFNPETFLWTVELRRKLATDDNNDHQFIPGKDASPPTTDMVLPGDPIRGEKLYKEKTCASCHGEQGEGEFIEGKGWPHPRNQRVSGPAVRKSVSLSRPRRLQNIAHALKKWDEHPPESLMPFVPLSPQEAEDISSWLRLQYIPNGK